MRELLTVLKIAVGNQELFQYNQINEVQILLRSSQGRQLL